MTLEVKAYACYNLDDKIRNQSSSGGFFSVLADYWLELDSNQSELNVVYGVAMTKDCYCAEYIRVTNKTDIGKLRGSKYIQAKVGNTFNMVKKDLEDSRNVLFSGTGCVINGLKKYLKKEYENLICVDVICHGAPSPLLWETYVKHHEKEYGKLQEINFRCKDYGWKDFGMKENQRYISKDKDAFMRMFLRDYCLRPSCYECRAKKVKKSDFTMADFWGIENIAPEMNDGKGTSLVLVRTPRGKEIFEELKKFLEIKEVSYIDGVRYNPSEYKSVVRPEQRNYFFLDMHNMTFDELEKKYASPVQLSLTEKIKRKVKSFLRRWKMLFVKYRGGVIQRSNTDYGLLFTFDEEHKELVECRK